MEAKRSRIRKDKSELTDKQQEIFVLMLKGYDNQKIADTLGVINGTVRVHLYSVFKHFSVHTRSELLALYVCKHSLALEENKIKGAY